MKVSDVSHILSSKDSGLMSDGDGSELVGLEYIEEQAYRGVYSGGGAQAGESGMAIGPGLCLRLGL